jgi:amino acid transporter
MSRVHNPLAAVDGCRICSKNLKVDERLQQAGTRAATDLPVSSRSVASGLALGVMSWSFGLPGAALLAGLLVVAPVAANAWAWIFAGFWVLVAAAGRALDLATGDRP